MEAVLVVILLAVVVFLLIKRANSNSESTVNQGTLFSLVKEVVELRKDIRELKRDVTDSNNALLEKIDLLQQSGIVAQPAPTPPIEIIQIIREEPPVPVSEQVIEEAIPVLDYPSYEQAEESATTAVDHEIMEEAVAAFIPHIPAGQQREFREQESFTDKWLRNNPDLEKFIGENLINKIGIAVLVLGIAFFVKYAIDKDWINETGRVCIGLLCGAILVGIAHFMRNTYRSFSSVLAGGGIAVFYFTIAFGFHQYHLMSQTAAFVIMVIITAFAIALSVLYDKLELAIIATIGGFITPFLLSTGEGNYIILFTYLVILDAGVLLLAYFKRWTPINIIALFFTEIIFAGWLITTINGNKPISYPTALLFASLFYFIFLAMNMVNQIKNKDKFKPFDFIILLLISSSYFAAGITLLHFWNSGAYEGIFTLSLSMVNLGLAYYVFKKGDTDKNLFFLLVGITLTFITLTIPIQLHGHAITLFWSAEFVLLYWLSIYSGIRIFKYSSLLICALTLISLGMDWEKASKLHPVGLAVIYSDLQGIVTNVVAIAAFAIWWLLLRKNEEETIAAIPVKSLTIMALAIAVGLFYITCIFGVNFGFHGYTRSYAMPNVYHRMITGLIALAFILIIQKEKKHRYMWLQMAAVAACFVLTLASIGEINELRDSVLNHKVNLIHFYMHWADGAILGLLFYRLIQNLRTHPDIVEDAGKPLSVLLTIAILVFLSTEIQQIYVMAGYNGTNVSILKNQYSKSGLTVLWALSSFALMWLGMKHQNKTLRIISLGLFSIVLLKLFIADISGISEGGKILAFILLGVLLLTVSFMYQKLKKIIIDDKKDKEE